MAIAKTAEIASGIDINGFLAIGIIMYWLSIPLAGSVSSTRTESSEATDTLWTIRSFLDLDG